jgi:hypothetical protein
MGEAEFDLDAGRIYIHSHIITYGEAASDEWTELVRDEIECMWNEPGAHIFFRDQHLKVVFNITAEVKKDIDQLEIISNTDPRNNYFRIEDFIHGNISFVDGSGCNTGYFLTENLYKGSTTAAHEYGHTLGLNHPKHLDIRGQGVPGIMYARGTLVDPEFQYDPTKPPGTKGGTLHPKNRIVKQEDVEALKLEKLFNPTHKAIVGAFTNIYHWKHVPGSIEMG